MITPSDLFQEIYWALTANKIRSILTILGIVIGIASVIAMVSIGAGAQASIQQSIQSVGSNLVIVMPGAQRGVGMSASAGRGSATTLTQEDVDALQQSLQHIQAIAPELSRRYQITTKGKNTNTQVTGTTPSYPDVRNIEIQDGSFISDIQLKSASRVAVLGPTTRDDLFGQDTNALGKVIRIGAANFTIIGITKAKGGSGFSNPDDAVYVPLTAAQRFLSGDTYVSTISIKADSQESMIDVQDQTNSILLLRHHIPNPQLADFSVLNQQDIVATAQTITNTFTLLLASIAGISLVVGGIGIMNMMLTAVTERTREIGLRKALGAEKRDIALQFLLEAIALTLCGGIIGIILGWLLAFIAHLLANIPTQTTLSSILLAFGVCSAIGIIFGYYPASRAAKLHPIEALRRD
ncbi:MAG: ABC transporter permease [bacterium]|nr:ABC transporter permease [bacterium]